MPRSCADEPSMRSPDAAAPTTIQFVNQTDALRKVYWLDGTGVRHWFLAARRARPRCRRRPSDTSRLAPCARRRMAIVEILRGTKPDLPGYVSSVSR